MKVFNKTKNCSIALNLSVAESFLERLKGLLGRKSLKESGGILLKPCYQIHTWFMKFPIDVLFLDKNFNVIHLIKELKPFRISGIYLNARSVIELPVGTIDKSNTEVGDSLAIQT